MISDTHDNASWKGNQQERGNLNNSLSSQNCLGVQSKLNYFLEANSNSKVASKSTLYLREQKYSLYSTLYLRENSTVRSVFCRSLYMVYPNAIAFYLCITKESCQCKLNVYKHIFKLWHPFNSSERKITSCLPPSLW